MNMYVFIRQRTIQPNIVEETQQRHCKNSSRQDSQAIKHELYYNYMTNDKQT